MDVFAYMILGFGICNFAVNVWMNEKIKELETDISYIQLLIEDIKKEIYNG